MIYKHTIIFLLLAFVSLSSAYAAENESVVFSDYAKDKSQFDTLWQNAKRYQNYIKSNQKNDFIIGGRLTTNEEFPSAIALVDKSGESFCTGNLIAPDIIATAGHCILNLFYEESANFKVLNSQLTKPLKTANLSDISEAIEFVIAESKHDIHVRVQGDNYFDIVQSIAVSKSWAEWNADVARYYLTGKREIRYTGSNVSDKAIIRLSRKFENLNIPAIINQSELEALKEGDYNKAVQVGFGYIIDPSIIENNSVTKAIAKEKLDQLKDKKYMVELPVNTIFDGKEGQRAGIGKPGSAACYGDSGGPTFVQLLNGQWRYFASLSKSVSNTGLCGENDESAWQSTASEKKKQTTDISDVWVL